MHPLFFVTGVVTSNSYYCTAFLKAEVASQAVGHLCLELLHLGLCLFKQLLEAPALSRKIETWLGSGVEVWRVQVRRSLTELGSEA